MEQTHSRERLSLGAILITGLLAPSTAHALHAGAHAPRAPVSLEWSALGTLPGAGPAVQQIVETAADPLRVYATTSAGLIVSHDRGATWQLVSRYPAAAWSIAYVTASPLDADLLLLCPYGDGIWRSDDGGVTWARPIAAPSDTWLWSPVFAPSCGAIVYVTASDGVWRSLDAGQTFTQVLSGIAALGGIGWETVVDPADERHAYFQAWYAGLYETSDTGDTWNARTFPAGTDGGLSLAVDPRDGDRLLLGDRGVYTSTDGGLTWTAPALGAYWIDEVAFDPHDGNRFYASARTGGIATSTDAGATWTLSVDPGLDPAGGGALAIVPSANDDRLVLVGDAGGVFRSTDRGATYQRANDGLAPVAAVDHLVVDPFDPNHLVAKSGGTAYASNDAGATWTEATGLLRASGHGFAADLVVPDRIYLTSFDERFWRSDDGGASFSVVSSAPGRWFAKVAPHPAIASRVFVTGNGLWRSDDGGATFASTSVPLGWTWAVAISAADTDVVYCAGESALYRSLDGGTTWMASIAPPPGIVREIVPDPLVADRAYAASPFSGFYESDDAGRTWTLRTSELEMADTAVATPLLPGLVLANDIAHARVWVSRDRGESAGTLGTGLVSSVARIAVAPRAIYAATLGSAVLVLR